MLVRLKGLCVEKTGHARIPQGKTSPKELYRNMALWQDILVLKRGRPLCMQLNENSRTTNKEALITVRNQSFDPLSSVAREENYCPTSLYILKFSSKILRTRLDNTL
jgi:hypothetical protein